MKSVFPLTPAPEQLSIVEILMKTNISCSLKKLPLDILIVISKFLNYSDILKWQQTCTTFHKILSDNSIWRGYCRRLDLYASKGIRNLQRHLVDYEKTKFLWLTSTYDYSILQQKSDYLCGILYLDSFVNSENLSPTIISGSWTGDIIQYKITLVEKCDPEALFDPVLFNDNPWNWTPPQTPCSTPIDPLPILVQGVKKLEEEKVLNFGKIVTMAHHSGLLAIGTSSHPYIHFQSLTKAKPILSDFKLSSPISALALTSRFCLASTSSTIQIYDFLTSTTLQPIHLSESDNIKHLSFISPTTIFIACTSGTWYTYSLTTRSILTTTTSIRGLASACTTPVIGGHRILAGYKDGNVRSWILNLTPTLLIIPLPILCSISDQVTSLTVFGNILVAGSWDGKIRIWDLKSNQRRTLTSRDKSPVMSLTVADGVLVSGHYNGSITSISFKRA